MPEPPQVSPRIDNQVIQITRKERIGVIVGRSVIRKASGFGWQMMSDTTVLPSKSSASVFSRYATDSLCLRIVCSGIPDDLAVVIHKVPCLHLHLIGIRAPAKTSKMHAGEK